MTIPRDKWPPGIPRGASGRDAFLMYIAQGWPLFFGGEEQVETVFDHDFGLHVLRRGDWELQLRDVTQFLVPYIDEVSGDRDQIVSTSEPSET